MFAMNNSGKPVRWQVAEISTMAAIPAVMYRFQETGDPLVMVWGAGGILVITCASTIAKALERGMSRVLRLDRSHDDEIPDGGPKHELEAGTGRGTYRLAQRSDWAD